MVQQGEAIDADAQHRSGVLPPIQAAENFGGAIEERALVGEAGERISAPGPLKGTAGLHLGLDVHELSQDQPAFPWRQTGEGEPAPEPAAIGVATAGVPAQPPLRGCDQGLQLVGEWRPVMGMQQLAQTGPLQLLRLQAQPVGQGSVHLQTARTLSEQRHGHGGVLDQLGRNVAQKIGVATGFRIVQQAARAVEPGHVLKTR